MYVVVVDTLDGRVHIEVPTSGGPETAARRALATARCEIDGDPDRMTVLEVVDVGLARRLSESELAPADLFEADQ